MFITRGAVARYAHRALTDGRAVPLFLAIGMTAVAPALAGGIEDLERCRQAYEAGAPDVAKSLCSRALKDTSLSPPTRAVGHLLRAWSTRGYPAALPDFEAAVRLAPDFGIAQRELGIVYYRLNRHDDALRALTIAVKLEPRDTTSWYFRGHVFVNLGRPADALRDAERATQLSPKWSEAEYLKGAMLARLGRLDRALEDFDRSLRLEPTHADALIRKASLRAELGEFKAAWADADAAVRARPREPRYLLDRGRIALLQGNDAAAIADMSNALARVEDRGLKLSGAIWLAIAVLRSRTELHHQPNVRLFIDDGNKTDWPAPPAWLYLATISRVKSDWKDATGDPADYMAQSRRAAMEPDRSPFEHRKCESGFFLGMYHVLAKDAARGQEFLWQAVSPRVDSWSYIGAKAELTRLQLLQAGGKFR